MSNPRAYVRCDGRRIELNLYDNATVNQVTIAADDAILLAKELLTQALRMKDVEARDKRADAYAAGNARHPLPLSGSGR
jgi:hypothetical protein